MDTAHLISDIVHRLKDVAGIQAIVLGGSRARGTHTDTSDIDLGIYYYPQAPLDLTNLGHIATEIDDAHRSGLLTDVGGWGPWINGGGWLTVQTVPFDFLYRDLAKIGRIMTDCLQGQIEIAYQPGHPHGFASYIYLAEMALCQPLWDPHNIITALKGQTRSYPAPLKQAVIAKFFWEADFSLKVAQKSVSRGDVAYAAGCCFRCVACLTHTLFALNEQYWMNEKGAVALAATFRQCPEQLKERVDIAFGQLEATAQAIEAAIKTLDHLIQDTRVLLPR